MNQNKNVNKLSRVRSFRLFKNSKLSISTSNSHRCCCHAMPSRQAITSSCHANLVQQMSGYYDCLMNKYGGLNFLLKCNYNEKFLSLTNLPQFYKSMLQHFLELKVAYNCAIGQDLVLFNNKEILIENQTIFYKEWFQKGIFLVQDLLQENGRLLTFPEFIQKYDVECNFLNYMQVVSAIP